jgi:predicted phosphodiesterase
MNAITRLPFMADMQDGADEDRFAIPERDGRRRRYRTIWISDIHLGTRGCNAKMLIDFLDSVDSDTIYLVGDIIDGWRLKKRFYWPAAHNDLVCRDMNRAKRGTRVVYIPGNQDEMYRQFTGLSFGGVEIRRKAIHETADGRKLLVLHGDFFDVITRYHKWLALAGFNDEPIRSRAVGSISGWEPGTEFKLENGQTWKVLKGSMKLRKPMSAPEILVVPGLMGRWFLQVDEDLPKARVYRVD